MKKGLITVVLTAGLWIVPAAWGQGGHDGHAHSHKAEREQGAEIKGHVIDIVCYTRHSAIGEKHLKCATTCAQTGIPMGILEDGTNEIYLVFPPGHQNPNEQLMAFLEKDVLAKGTIHRKGGLKGITISSITERKD